MQRTVASTATRAFLSTALISVVAILCLFLFVKPAHAETMEELQQRIEETNDELETANEKVAELEAQIEDNQQRIAEIEEELPTKRAQAATSIRAEFKLQQSSQGLLDLILSADDFNDFLLAVEFLNSISTYNAEQVSELVALEDELEQAQTELDTQLAAAEQQRQEASDALTAAIEARDALQEAQIAEQLAQQEEALAALEEAETMEGSTFTTETGGTATVEVPSSTDDGTYTGFSGDSIDWDVDHDTFVETWGARIDAYLAGSPLAGYGTTFAEAAWQYGVDPRFSPAIACVESSKGAYCFRPHNAWGWGNASWPDWETAIYAHVAGLASGYGGYLTVAGARKYCPSNAAAWYSSVAANMQMI